VVEDGCANVRQGDVVAVSSVVMASDDPTGVETYPTPHGVAVLTQTCDVVQPSKSRCLVAPVFQATADEVNAAQKGRKPLHLYWSPGPETGASSLLADMELAASLPKSALVGKMIVARAADQTSGAAASDVAARVGRAFSRFPFPDEVHPVFQKLRNHAQAKAGGTGSFGKVLDLIEDLRVSADQWISPGRRMRLLVVVPEQCTAPADDHDPRWTASRVIGLRPQEQLANLSLDRVCELLLSNLGTADPDRTSLARLWSRFGSSLEESMLRPRLSAEVVAFDVEVVAAEDLSFREYQQSESLDLEALSSPVLTAS
jgi:hypothetical protein